MCLRRVLRVKLMETTRKQRHSFAQNAKRQRGKVMVYIKKKLVVNN